MAELRARPDRRSPRGASYWLWMLVVAMAAVVATMAVVNPFLPADRAIGRDAFGQDFLAFYAAGQMALAGNAADLYDLDATARLQREIAEAAGYARVAIVAPWLNPPHAAWLFAPLAMLPLRAALACWTIVNLACLAATAMLLMRIVGEATDRRRDRWLVPALLAVAPPTIQALGHGQNSAVSLLLLTLAVVAWRGGRPLWAGLACAALCYKPQLALIVGVALVATLGWRVLVGLMLGLVPQLLVAVVTLPGAVGAFVARVPANLRELQLARPFPWHRHTTFTGFWRSLSQGDAAGETGAWVAVLSIACMACVAVGVIAVWWTLRRRHSGDGDRFIALVVLATPLLMPYFVDYDLLLLAVAAALVARDALATGGRAGWLVASGIAAYVWLAINPSLAGETGLNLTVPLLALLCAAQARRCVRVETLTMNDVVPAGQNIDAPIERIAA